MSAGRDQGPLLVLAAGGTGGHMFPAQALAEEMLTRGWRVRLSTDARGARYATGFPPEVAVEAVSSATFARGGAAARALVPLRLGSGILSAISAMRRQPPALVAGFGGYPSVPALAAAWTLRLPRLIHEQNGVMGKVNAWFAPRVDRVACGVWPTVLPAGATGVHVGNPIRAAVKARVGAPYQPPAPGAPVHVLVIGGSQGARVLSDVIPAALAGLPEDWRRHLKVAHQARPEDMQRVIDAYAAAGIEAEVAQFFANVPDRLEAAQLVISRSGASSVADISAVGRPAILIPFAAATADHQAANARGLVEAGAAQMIREEELTSGELGAVLLSLLEDPAALARMAAAAAGQGRPDAAQALADLVEALADNQNKRQAA